MSPASYYCWLADRRWTWLGLHRIQPAPDRNYPLSALVIFPCLTALIATAVFAGIGLLVSMASNSQTSGIPAFIYWIVAVMGFSGSFVHRTFACLAWNQRAARIRATGRPAATSGPGILSRWILGPFYLLVIAVITPLALLTAIENVRGALKWRSVRNQLTAQGEKLNLRELFLPPVPDDQNTFGVPPFNRLLRDGRGSAGINTNTLEEFRVFQLPREVTPQREPGDRRPLSLADWAASFRVALSNQALPKGTRGKEPHLPTYATPPASADEATVVLTALSGGEPLLTSICEASGRPRAVFPVHWEDGFNTLLPHLAQLKGLSRLLDVRVAALLARGDTSRAFADTECALRLANVLREEPLIISQLVRFAQNAIADQTVWRGIAAHAWNDAQLTALQQQLSTNDFIPSLVLAFEGERALGVTTLDLLARDRRQFQEQGLGDFSGSDNSGGPGLNLFPTGWIRQNQAALARYYQDVITFVRALTDQPPVAGLAASLREFASVGEAPLIRQLGSPSPYNIFVRMLAGAISNTLTKAVRADAQSQCTATACALERYRLKHGVYPESLAGLVPEFVAEVPRDPITNQPLHYARTQDGFFRLWSVGENGADDGGVFRRGKREGGDLDWPWPYQMPD